LPLAGRWHRHPSHGGNRWGQPEPRHSNDIREGSAVPPYQGLRNGMELMTRFERGILSVMAIAAILFVALTWRLFAAI